MTQHNLTTAHKNTSTYGTKFHNKFFACPTTTAAQRKNSRLIPIVGYAGKFFCVLSPNQQLPSISLSVFIIRNDSDGIVTWLLDSVWSSCININVFRPPVSCSCCEADGHDGRANKKKLIHTRIEYYLILASLTEKTLSRISKREFIGYVTFMADDSGWLLVAWCAAERLELQRSWKNLLEFETFRP